MLKWFSLIVRQVLIALFCLLPLCACHSWTLLHIPSTKLPSQVDVRIVKHALGETAIPLHPQRVVSFNGYSTEVAILLGVKLCGYYQRGMRSEWQRFDLSIGDPPNIEKVLALKPDLLVGSRGLLQELYSVWSHIAPTFVYELKNDTKWKQPFIEVAQALGQTEESAKQIVALYNARVAKFRASMGEKLKQTRVSVVHISPGKIIVRTQDSFSGAILSELGLERPPSQKLNTTPITKIVGDSSWYQIPSELLTLIDGDILFVVSPSFPTLTNSQFMLEQLKSEPLWSKLKVVRQGKVYLVGEYWLTGNYLSALRVLDDLFKYLVTLQ